MTRHSEGEPAHDESQPRAAVPHHSLWRLLLTGWAGLLVFVLLLRLWLAEGELLLLIYLLLAGSFTAAIVLDALWSRGR